MSSPGCVEYDLRDRTVSHPTQNIEEIGTAWVVAKDWKQGREATEPPTCSCRFPSGSSPQATWDACLQNLSRSRRTGTPNAPCTPHTPAPAQANSQSRLPQTTSTSLLYSDPAQFCRIWRRHTNLSITGCHPRENKWEALSTWPYRIKRRHTILRFTPNW